MAKAGLEVKLAGGQQIMGGYSVKVFNCGGMGTGTYTFDPLNGNYQYAANTGNVTILPPTVDCAIDVLLDVGLSSGTTSFSGFTVGFTGDAITTTNGHKFIISIRRMLGISTYTVKALQ